jgi:hypothetical protein
MKLSLSPIIRFLDLSPLDRRRNGGARGAGAEGGEEEVGDRWWRVDDGGSYKGTLLLAAFLRCNTRAVGHVFQNSAIFFRDQFHVLRRGPFMRDTLGACIGLSPL